MSYIILFPLILTNIIIFLLFNSSSAANSMYNVQTYGANSDGKSDSSNAFVSAWTAACASTSAATIYVPKGSYLLNNVYFFGQSCKSNDITIHIEGTLIAPSDYNVIGKSGNWIKFERVNGVSIVGGTLDGQGTRLWTCKNSGKGCPKGATV